MFRFAARIRDALLRLDRHRQRRAHPDRHRRRRDPSPTSSSASLAPFRAAHLAFASTVRRQQCATPKPRSVFGSVRFDLKPFRVARLSRSRCFPLVHPRRLSMKPRRGVSKRTRARSFDLARRVGHCRSNESWVLQSCLKKNYELKLSSVVLCYFLPYQDIVKTHEK